MYSPFLGIARPQSQFSHSCFCERFIYSQDRSVGPHISCSRIGRSIVRIYRSLTDTWMCKLGLKLRNSFSGNIFVSNFWYWFFAVKSLKYFGTPSQIFLLNLRGQYIHTFVHLNKILAPSFNLFFVFFYIRLFSTHQLRQQALVLIRSLNQHEQQQTIHKVVNTTSSNQFQGNQMKWR